jgi:hypothetical protein
MTSPGGLSSAQLWTLKDISGPFKAVSTECNLHSSSWGVMRAKTLGALSQSSELLVHPPEN